MGIGGTLSIKWPLRQFKLILFLQFFLRTQRKVEKEQLPCSIPKMDKNLVLQINSANFFHWNQCKFVAEFIWRPNKNGQNIFWALFWRKTKLEKWEKKKLTSNSNLGVWRQKRLRTQSARVSIFPYNVVDGDGQWCLLICQRNRVINDLLLSLFQSNFFCSANFFISPTLFGTWNKTNHYETPPNFHSHPSSCRAIIWCMPGA